MIRYHTINIEILCLTSPAKKDIKTLTATRRVAGNVMAFVPSKSGSTMVDCSSGRLVMSSLVTHVQCMHTVCVVMVCVFVLLQLSDF